LSETIKFGEGSVAKGSGDTPVSLEEATRNRGHGGSRPGAGRPRKIHQAPAVVIPGAPRWCVYQTHPQAERLAAADLTRTGYHGYAPLIAVRRQDVVIRSLFHKVRVARFPGYGFVELAPGEPWLPILEAAGVARILRSPDGRPARVPVGEIERHLLDDERLCDLQRETMPPLPAGNRVTILHGALTSFEGFVIECDG
jgi:transcription antitermination factor NusG